MYYSHISLYVAWLARLLSPSEYLHLLFPLLGGLFLPNLWMANCFSSLTSDLKGYLLGEVFSKRANYSLPHCPGSEPWSVPDIIYLLVICLEMSPWIASFSLSWEVSPPSWSSKFGPSILSRFLSILSLSAGTCLKPWADDVCPWSLVFLLPEPSVSESDMAFYILMPCLHRGPSWNFLSLRDSCYHSYTH